MSIRAHYILVLANFGWSRRSPDLLLKEACISLTSCHAIIHSRSSPVFSGLHEVRALMKVSALSIFCSCRIYAWLSGYESILTRFHQLSHPIISVSEIPIQPWPARYASNQVFLLFLIYLLKQASEGSVIWSEPLPHYRPRWALHHWVILSKARHPCYLLTKHPCRWLLR